MLRRYVALVAIMLALVAILSGLSVGQMGTKTQPGTTDSPAVSVAPPHVAPPDDLSRPVPGARLPESSPSSAPQNGVDSNWGGYIYCAAGLTGQDCLNSNAASGVTEVEGEWNVPAVVSTSSSATEKSSTWVGIGGDDSSKSLVQAGTEEDVTTSGSASYYAWWEMLPSSETEVSLTVNPGDTVFVEVLYAGTNIVGEQQWFFEIEDLTSGNSWSSTETCDVLPSCTGSTFASADWIEEAVCTSACTGNNPVISQMPPFQRVAMSDDQFALGGSSSTTTLSPSLSANLIDMYLLDTTYVTGCTNNIVTPSTGCVLIDPSTLYTGLFFAEYMMNTMDCLTSGSGGGYGCYSLSQTGADFGQTIAANFDISSADDFSPSGAGNLAIGMSVEGPSSTTCNDPTHDVPTTQSPRIAEDGSGYYGRQFTVCSGIPTGEYQVALSVWFVPLGSTIGSSGSLMLTETGWLTPWLSNPALTVSTDLSASTPTASPPTVDVGMQVTFSVSATGGSGSYSYDWIGLPAGCQNANLTQVTCAPDSSGTSEISVTITDSNGWLVTTKTLAFVVAPELAASIAASPSTSIDVGQSVTFSGQAAGGAAPYSYAWTIGFGCSNSGAASDICTPSSSGTSDVSLTVTDDNDGTAEAYYSYTVYAQLTAGGITPSNRTIAPGGSVTLTAAPAGGTAPFTYAWYSGSSSTCSGDAIISGATGSTYLASPGSSTYYCYSVSDSSTPSEHATSGTDLVTVTAALEAGPVSPTNPSIDAGQPVTLQSSVSGGVAPYSYTWFEGSSLSCAGDGAISGSNSASLLVSPSVGMYFCYSVSDSENPPSSATSVTDYVTVNSELLAGSIAPTSPTVALGNSVKLGAQPSGGTPPYSYQWYGGSSSSCGDDGAISGAVLSTYLTTPSSNTFYCYSVTDSAVTPESATSSTDLVTVTGLPPQTYLVTFTETGLPSSTAWTVTVRGTPQTAVQSSIEFSLANGSYYFTIGTAVLGYAASPPSGNVVVNGSAATVAVEFEPSSPGVEVAAMAISSPISWDLAYDSESGLVFVGGGCGLFEFNPRNDSVVRQIGFGSGICPYFSYLAYDAVSNNLFAADYEDNAIWVLNATSGAEVTKITNFAAGVGGAASPSEAMDSIAVDPSTGEVFVLGGQTSGSGPFTGTLNGISVMTAQGSPVGQIDPLTSPSNEQVWAMAFDPATGMLDAFSAQSFMVVNPADSLSGSVQCQVVPTTSACADYPASTYNIWGRSAVYDPYDTTVYSMELSGSEDMPVCPPGYGQVLVGINPSSSPEITSETCIPTSGSASLDLGMGYDGVVVDGEMKGEIALVNMTTDSVVGNLTPSGSEYLGASQYVPGSQGMYLVDADLNEVYHFEPSQPVVATVDLSPDTPLDLMGDQSTFLAADAYDQFGNFVSDATLSWTVVPSDLGSFSPTSGTSVEFTAAELSGTGSLCVGASLNANGTDEACLSLQVVGPTTFPLTFSETGLPSGTEWSITIGASSYSSTGTSITLSVVNGTYSYTVGVVPGYHTKASGSVTVKGSAEMVIVSFSGTTYTVKFSESGFTKAWKTKWCVTFNGAEKCTTSTAISFTGVANGTYPYTVLPVANYTLKGPYAGDVTISGGGQGTTALTVELHWTLVKYSVKFKEKGLPSGTSWSVTLDGKTVTSTSAEIPFSLSNGTYDFTDEANGYTGSPPAGAITIDGSAVSQTVGFTS